MRDNDRDPEANCPVKKPLIAAIHGHTIGAGMSCALQCDIIIAADNTQMAIGEVKRGLPPTWVLVRCFHSLPYRIAMEMNLTGDPISASDAYRWGMVNCVVPREQLMETAFQMARRILDAAPLAVRAAKRKAQLILGMPLEQALRLDVGEEARNSEDLQEGMRAFGERRKPEWKAR
ncbi:MAG: enoyl-CoA hydratase/isomerase family protein [Chloroflexi bacterium]|nr:enoyl-CoA hydratase/isomerase family protein [Chloroflexota bacterium]